MKQSVSKTFMKLNRGCYSLEKLNSCSFMCATSITLETIINSEISLKDKYWFVCKKLATKEENQQIAVKVAEIVLPIFEKQYPKNKAPREAIKSAKSYISGHVSLEILLIKRRIAADAAYAAYGVAYAAYADAAAYDITADAADVAYATAYIAAYAVDAAAYAAAATYSIYVADIAVANAAANAAANANAVAYTDTDIEKQLQDYLLTFIQ